jgi:hypothetical protein
MRTIPIAPVASEFSDCEESGIVPKQNLPLARREFLKGSGIFDGHLGCRFRTGWFSAFHGVGS